MKVFLFVWFGQLASLIGSGLTGFALGVWIYQQHGSITEFALITLFTTLPQILVSPFAGVWVDRWSRRWTMILSDAGSCLCTAGIAALLFTNNLAVWHIYIATAISSCFSAFQWPAYTASISLLVADEDLSRANGLVQSGNSASQLLSPLLAGFLVINIGLSGIIAIDFVTFGIAVIILMSVIFKDDISSSQVSSSKSNFFQDLKEGFMYVLTQRGLFGLLIFFSLINLFSGFVVVLFQPLVLSFYSPATLGIIESIGGAGMLLGSLLMVAWAGPKRIMLTIFSVLILMATSLIVMGFHSSVIFLSAGSFIFLFGSPVIRTCTQVIWQRKVDVSLQGRVFAFRRMFARMAIPIAAILAGPIDTYLFEPLMAPDGILSHNLGKVIGIGHGHGISLMLIVLGTAIAVSVAIALFFPPLHSVEN